MSGEKKTAPQNQGAEDLFQLLERKGINSEKLAKRLGIPQHIVEGWCRGSGVPDVWQVKRIAQILNCDLQELYLAIIRTG